MNKASLVLTLLVCLPVLAADDAKPWPQKGDTVYVAGDLTGHFMSATLVLGWSTITVPACTPVTVAFHPKEDSLFVRDESRGAAFKLCGDARAAVQKDAAACAAAGRSSFIRKADCYLLAAAH